MNASKQEICNVLHHLDKVSNYSFFKIFTLFTSGRFAKLSPLILQSFRLQEKHFLLSMKKTELKQGQIFFWSMFVTTFWNIVNDIFLTGHHFQMSGKVNQNNRSHSTYNYDIISQFPTFLKSRKSGPFPCVCGGKAEI